MQYQAFFGSKALPLCPVTAHTLTNPPPLFHRPAAVTIERPVTAGNKTCAATGTAFAVHRISCYLGTHFLVSREDSGAKVPAQEGIGNQLRTDARVIAIVQQEAKPAAIVGAQAADEFFYPAGLCFVHTGQLTHGRTPACNWSWPHRPPVPQWRRRFSRFSPSSSR